nr:MAG TPA: hypothetical protein [Caudoviricetes sp.]
MCYTESHGLGVIVQGPLSAMGGGPVCYPGAVDHGRR